MAHVEKYTRNQVGKMLRHYRRENKNYSNENIDQEKTKLNYSMLTEDENRSRNAKYVLNLAENLKTLKRDDVKVMCDWVVTAPEQISDNEMKKFFELTFQFLSERYGKENNMNIISADVHMDELRPHMHFAFVPLIEKENFLKVNAKKVINRNELKIFHKQFSEFMNEKFGRDIGLIKNDDVVRNLNLNELKNVTKVLETANENLDQKLNVNVLNYKKSVNTLEKDIEKLKKENEMLKQLNQKNDKKIKTLLKNGSDVYVEQVELKNEKLENELSLSRATKKNIPAIEEMEQLFDDVTKNKITKVDFFEELFFLLKRLVSEVEKALLKAREDIAEAHNQKLIDDAKKHRESLQQRIERSKSSYNGGLFKRKRKTRNDDFER